MEFFGCGGMTCMCRNEIDNLRDEFAAAADIATAAKRPRYANFRYIVAMPEPSWVVRRRKGGTPSSGQGLLRRNSSELRKRLSNRPDDYEEELRALDNRHTKTPPHLLTPLPNPGTPISNLSTPQHPSSGRGDSGSKEMGKERIKAMQMMLGGDTIVQRLGKHPTASPWLNSDRSHRPTEDTRAPFRVFPPAP